MTMNGQYDLEKLIQMVKERPIIWDKTMEGYRSKQFTQPAWQEIFYEMIDGYHLMDENQQKEAGEYTYLSILFK